MAESVYHCCTVKTASQWFKAFFKDIIFYKYSNLQMVNYQDIRYVEPKRKGVIVTALYTGWPVFDSLPKSDDYRVFFLRDPRDCVVSWYHSVRYSHGPSGDIPALRRKLNSLNLDDGLKFAIDYWQHKKKYFSMQRSWWEHAPQHVFTYELFAKDPFQFFKSVFRHVEIEMPDEVLSDLLKRYSFKHRCGRVQGQEDIYSNYRKGVAGDWQNHFTSSVYDYFRKATNNVHIELGYR